MVNESAHRLIQITDPHIGSRSGYQLLGLDTGRSLDEVLSAITAEPTAAELLVATGDISANGAEESYLRFLHKMQSLTMPWLWLPGNHDSPEQMDQLARARRPHVAVLGNWRLILMDSSVAGRIGGGFDQRELNRLQELLALYVDHPVLIMLHHQPVPVGSAWIDGHMLRQGREEFMQWVLKAKNVQAITWGHVHQQYDSQLEHIGLHATPSTSVQFTPGSGPFAVDEEMPGYRWFELCDDGSYQTGVERVAISSYSVDIASSGY